MFFFGKRVSFFKIKLKSNNKKKFLIFWFLKGSFMFGIYSLENGFIFPKQIEALRRVLTIKTLQKIHYFVRIKPVFVYRLKKKSMRMGRGLGKFFNFFFPLRKNTIFFEVVFFCRFFFFKYFCKKALKKFAIKCAICQNKNIFYWKKYWFFYFLNCR